MIYKTSYAFLRTIDTSIEREYRFVFLLNAIEFGTIVDLEEKF